MNEPKANSRDDDAATAAPEPALLAPAGARPPGQLATGGRYVPNVPVTTHRGEAVMFYDDLVRGKVVVVSFMSVANDAIYPVCGNLAAVQRLLGSKMGRSVFFCSITVEAEADTPERLAAFARRCGAGDGWHFITGQPEALEAIKSAFFIHDGGHAGHVHGAADCSRGLLRYGNDAAGLWASAPAKAAPALIAARLSWIGEPAKKVSGGVRRGGPFPSQRHV